MADITVGFVLTIVLGVASALLLITYLVVGLIWLVAELWAWRCRRRELRERRAVIAGVAEELGRRESKAKGLA